MHIFVLFDPLPLSVFVYFPYLNFKGQGCMRSMILSPSYSPIAYQASVAGYLITMATVQYNVNLLPSQGHAKLETVNSKSQTALLVACRSGQIPMIEFLTLKGNYQECINWRAVSVKSLIIDLICGL